MIDPAFPCRLGLVYTLKVQNVIVGCNVRVMGSGQHFANDLQTLFVPQLEQNAPSWTRLPHCSQKPMDAGGGNCC